MTRVARKSILIVDDTPENVQLLMTVLDQQGYRVRIAPGGERALATVEKEPPDLILLDIAMPDMNGFEVCSQLKTDDRFREIPVIFISALDEVFDKLTAFQVGGIDYITKPFQVEEVLARVNTHLTMQEMSHQLLIQNQQLQEQNQEFEAFAHTVAHDLKSPLATVVGFLELMREDGESNPEFIGLSLNSAYKMFNIIDELLLLASVRKEEIQTVPVDMAATVHRALDRLGSMTTQYEPEIILPEEWCSAYGYAPWVEEIWVNYISNGLKYGGKPPRLELGSNLLPDGMARFWVWDNGSGIAPEAQSALFTEFTRLDTVRAQGHGLGLSIVRRIVDKLNGDVGVESSAGQGSVFYFTLPTG